MYDVVWKKMGVKVLSFRMERMETAIVYAGYTGGVLDVIFGNTN